MIDWNQKTLSSWKKSCDKFRKHLKKQRHSANSRHFANKCLYSQSYGAIVFPVVMGCEGWTIKKAKHWKIDAFELWCWRRLLRVPWTAWRSNQPILKEISPEYSFEGLMLKLKLQFFGHLLWRANSLEKTLMLWKIEGRRRRGQQRMRRLEGNNDSVHMSWANSGRWWTTGRLGVQQSLGSQSHSDMTEWLSNDWLEELSASLTNLAKYLLLRCDQTS